MLVVAQQFIPYPNPYPTPGIEIPMQPKPGVPIGPGGSTAVPFPTNTGGSITDVFAAPFHFPLDWKLILAILVLILSVNAVETWYPEYVWYYVSILLLGTITLSSSRFGNFGSALKSLIG